ncbi:hypothetical protein NSA24_00790 [Clostridioides mangenotii]|nr:MULTISPECIES: hypothetical protein [Clostridioides]MCR1953363.1 hypothetical protein [Clostridioides mangenotii]
MQNKNKEPVKSNFISSLWCLRYLIRGLKFMKDDSVDILMKKESNYE